MLLPLNSRFRWPEHLHALNISPQKLRLLQKRSGGTCLYEDGKPQVNPIESPTLHPKTLLYRTRKAAGFHMKGKKSRMAHSVDINFWKCKAWHTNVTNGEMPEFSAWK